MENLLRKFVRSNSKSPQKQFSDSKNLSDNPYDSFGIHSWNTESREVDDLLLIDKKKRSSLESSIKFAPGPLMKARSHSPRKSTRSDTARKANRKSTSSKKKITTVLNQLDYLHSQCHLEGCRADIVVNTTKFLVCRHQLSHASAFFKDLLTEQNNCKDIYVSVANILDPSPATQFKWFVESSIPCPALKDVSDETLETCMRLSKKFQAKGLELRCVKYLIENCCRREPIIVLCWLNWSLKHKFDVKTQTALLPSITRLSLYALERHRHMITEKLYCDIVTAKLKGTYEKIVKVIMDIHETDHFTVDLELCPRCKRTKTGLKIKLHCIPCRKLIGCDKCIKEGCEITSQDFEEMRAYFKCSHDMRPLNALTDDCYCQISSMAKHFEM